MCLSFVSAGRVFRQFLRSDHSDSRANHLVVAAHIPSDSAVSAPRHILYEGLPRFALVVPQLAPSNVLSWAGACSRA